MAQQAAEPPSPTLPGPVHGLDERGARTCLSAKRAIEASMCSSREAGATDEAHAARGRSTTRTPARRSRRNRSSSSVKRKTPGSKPPTRSNHERATTRGGGDPRGVGRLVAAAVVAVAGGLREARAESVQFPVVERVDRPDADTSCGPTAATPQRSALTSLATVRGSLIVASGLSSRIEARVVTAGESRCAQRRSQRCDPPYRIRRRGTGQQGRREVVAGRVVQH